MTAKLRDVLALVAAIYGNIWDATCSEHSFHSLLVKYSPNGDRLWFNLQCSGSSGGISSPRACVTADGSTFMASAVDEAMEGHSTVGESDAFLRKFDSSGTMEWSHQWGSTNYDSPHALLCDMNGDVTVAGLTQGAITMGTGTGNVKFGVGNDWDCFATKFTSEGTELWSKMWGSDGLDYCKNAAVDMNNNIYLTGVTAGTSFNGVAKGEASKAAFVLALDPQGNAFSTVLIGNAILIDAENSTYLGGTTSGELDGNSPGSEQDAGFIRKVLSNGTWQWTRWILGDNGIHNTNGINIIHGLAFDEEGGLWFAGKAQGSYAGQTWTGVHDAILGRVDRSTGDVKHAPLPPLPHFEIKQIGANDHDIFFAAVPERHGTGSVYACGYYEGVFNNGGSISHSGGDNAGKDALLVKFNADRTVDWSVQIAGPANVDIMDSFYTCMLDSSDNVIVSGRMPMSPLPPACLCSLLPLLCPAYPPCIAHDAYGLSARKLALTHV
jgi:hypothetical protein